MQYGLKQFVVGAVDLGGYGRNITKTSAEPNSK